MPQAARPSGRLTILMMSHLSGLDYAILGTYLVATVAMGLMIGRRVTSGSDFFLAGRSLPWWAIGFSLVATDIGGTDIIGVGGAAFTHGLAVSNFDWIGCIPAMIVAAFVFIPVFWRAGVYTIPEFLERRFDVRIRTALAICWLVFMACNIGIMLFASAKLMQVLFPGSATAWILLTAVLVGVYTFSGGLAAVVYTDVLQCIILIGGCLLVVVLGVAESGGVSELLARIQAAAQARAASLNASATAGDMTRLILPVDTPSPFPWTGILFGLGMILGPAYWIGNQAIVQRSLGAKSEFEAKAAYVWGALLKNIIPLVIAVPGLIALVKFPDLASGDEAIPTLVARMLPTGIKGLFLAAFLAALMSSVDSYLNSAATILTHDIYRRLIRPQAHDATLLRIGRWTTAALMVWGILFGLVLSRFQGSGIYAIFQTLMAFFQGPAFAVLILGILWRRASSTAAFFGFLGGVACAVALFALNQKPVYTFLGWAPLFKISEPFLYFSVWAFLTTVVLVFLISLIAPPDRAPSSPSTTHRTP